MGLAGLFRTAFEIIEPTQTFDPSKMTFWFG